MDKQKQIEEMAKVLSTVKRCEALAVSECIKKKCQYPHYGGVTCIAEHQAEYLYNAGYRKIPEGEEWDKVGIRLVQARKETAKKIFDKLYTWLDLEEIEKYGFVTIQKFDFLRKYREIYKEISEGTEDVKNE
jgi:hypothetical protein